MDKEAIVELYKSTGSIKSTARIAGICEQSARRILLDAGAYTSETANEIAKRIEQGEDPHQIAEDMGVSWKTVNSYMKYQKGTYCVGRKSRNAERIAACRQRKRMKERGEPS